MSRYSLILTLLLAGCGTHSVKVPRALLTATPMPVLSGPRTNESLAYHIFDLREAVMDANADKALVRSMLEANGKLE